MKEKMTRKSIWAAHAVLAILFIAMVEADDGVVTFWRKKVTMTCPEEGKWYYEKEEIPDASANKTYEIEYANDKKGTYHCEYEAIKYYFYVQGNVCENCFELDAATFGLAIFMDMLLTALMMVITYRCTKKRSSVDVTHTSKAPAPSRSHGPPVPSPDYESLDPRTRSHGTYSEVNRMG